MPAIDYEALRARHEEFGPLQHLTDDELERLREFTPFSGVMSDLAFLATCEVQERKAL